MAHVLFMILCAIFVFTLQPLAISAQFQRTHTLTGLSDHTTSWNGLGASLYSLYQNARIPAAAFPVLITSIYFTAITGLQVVTPLLFDFPLRNVSTPRSVRTIIGFPDFSAAPGVGDVNDPNSVAGGVRASGGVFTFNWYMANTALSLLGGNISFTAPGVSDNAVYDTLIYGGLPVNGTASVNRTEFNVVCGNLPQDPIVTPLAGEDLYLNLNFLSSADDGAFLNMTDTVLFTDAFGAGVTAGGANTTMVLPFGNLGDTSDSVLFHIPQSQNLSHSMGRNLVFYAMHFEESPGMAFLPAFAGPILDDSGSSGRVTAVNVDERLLNSLNSKRPPFSISIQVIGCSLQMLRTTSTLNSATNTLEQSERRTARSSSWDAWVPDGSDADGAFSGWWPGQYQPDSAMPISVSTSRLGALAIQATLCPVDNPNDPVLVPACHLATTAEQYLTSTLYGPPTVANISDSETWYVRNSTNATLSNLERALERATAMMIWSAARGSNVAMYSGTPSQFSLFPQSLDTQTSETIMYESALVNKLEVKTAPLMVGFVSSVLLLIAAITILRPIVKLDRDASSVLDGTSLLQVMSLDTSRVAARLAEAGGRGGIAQRRAGMFLVKIVDGKLVPIESDNE
ncbi:hypothetical protein K488DRAFT_86872 [Vararia minispora EC-137]|uniref:Uncharacterized protein n=1 Tax=Vararia minispora EC-137 TaxID=1314806 RepID=A0ACB8QHS7_9AGAM|nr:hypothetical protein K488DRAFT_86872 [Vararia minispora EC-137]